ncbi:glutathione S-transferase kappa 1 [Parasteatoda tepidariorum]|uniref:glutathione S-transferase kappa 1 n=1 Tax=Parasteatoda tepidariorum TaxID=114398 RepID=UPI00077F962B|nr:glutathione S-transferase kappa 1 [Parasteatoda tepidariorum]
MAKSPVLIEFFYDIVSPYSFLAFEVLQRYKTLWSIELKLKPMLLAGVMKTSGNKPPAVVPSKGIYMAKDLKRLQKYFQVPLFLPSNLMDIIFKHGTLSVMRFVTAVDCVSPTDLENITRALWLRLYKDHKDIQELQSFREAGISIKMDPAVLEKALNTVNSSLVKDRLKDYTDEALNYGAFGAPMIVAHVNGTPEVFFGSDRFELLASVLGEKWLGPAPASVSSSKL